MRKKYFVALLLPLMGIGMIGCNNTSKTEKKRKMTITENVIEQRGNLDVEEYVLSNDNGMSVKILNYGAIVTAINVADKNDKVENVVLGFDDAKAYWTEPYSSNCCYLGAIVGRYGNRIAQGQFSIGDKSYSLAINNGPNHLHGGLKGFDKVIWHGEVFTKPNECGVVLSYVSHDGEEGYPGNFRIQVTYSLNDKNELRIRYKGTIDEPCPVNVTHHGYFNLTGNGKRDILDHQMQILADRYTVVDETLIPTGELRPVENTAMDFRTATTIGKRIDEVEGGYDHNYVLSDEKEALRLIADVFEPISGRRMEVLTTEPGVQFYSGNFLDGILTGPQQQAYNKHWGFCLETQHYPDSPNREAFPSTLLEPGEEYHHETIYRFSTK